MAEEGSRVITTQDVQNAARLAAVEVHVHTIRDSVARLEAGQNAQAAVNAAMAESMKKTEIMLATLTTQFTGYNNEVTKLNAVRDAEITKLNSTRDTVIGWRTGLAILAAIFTLIAGALLKEWLTGKP